MTPKSDKKSKQKCQDRHALVHIDAAAEPTQYWGIIATALWEEIGGFNSLVD